MFTTMVTISVTLCLAIKSKVHLAGEKLLERYGMTETGMVVSNPLEGTLHPINHFPVRFLPSSSGIGLLAKVIVVLGLALKRLAP